MLLWLRETTEPVEGGELTMDMLYFNYENWCADSGIITKFAKNTLCARLRAKGYDNKRTKREQKTVTVVFGIRFKD